MGPLYREMHGFWGISGSPARVWAPAAVHDFFNSLFYAKRRSGARGRCMTYQLPFDSKDDPRWKLLDATRARLENARGQDEIIAIVRGSARGVISADGVTFVLRDYSHCHYVEEDAIAPLWKGQRFPMTSCISGWVMMNSKTAVIPDIFADDRIPHDVYRRTFVKSLVMAPVGFDTPMAAI